MPTGARRPRQGADSFMVKVAADVMAETERIARAAGISRNAYIAHALRHYNRLHAVTQGNRVRSLREHVVVLFPKVEAPVPAAKRATQKRRGR